MLIHARDGIGPIVRHYGGGDDRIRGGLDGEIDVIMKRPIIIVDVVMSVAGRVG